MDIGNWNKAIRINFYSELDLRFEFLKGFKIDDAAEHSDDFSIAKEMLMKVKKNNRKLFVGIETRMGKSTNNVLVAMQKSMVTEGKD